MLMTYQYRLFILSMIDSCVVLTAIFISWFLVGENMFLITVPFVISLIAIILSHHLFAVIFKLYKKVWEYASVGELLIILKIALYSIFVGLVVQQVIFQEIYFRFLAVIMLLHILFIGGSRFIWRIYREDRKSVV